MKPLILTTAAMVALSGVALAREQIAGEDRQYPGAALITSSPQGVASIKLTMGPTSAPHLPGGTGDQTGSSTQSHKKPKHDRAHSSLPN